ncbi:putative endonuclease/exonuclease/phosphatase [Heracleum sosnowskyi]|uniref:Endonuclease/exonuclease/phosphatase n=1 Tax=Heracleum sosnowskyi TaxID=360622 RepID=A0AAD8LZP2_9APIA|nr:putative endonuclease/exonuclease/phosphatase [Heracleum sosnowskyi]
MLVLSWNVQGVGKPCMFNVLKSQIQQYKPDLVFLCETKQISWQFENMKRALGFSNGIGVSRKGLSGGLALLWKEDVIVSLRSYSMTHIDAFVSGLNIPPWRFIGFYGNPDSGLRVHSWNLLKKLCFAIEGSWLCCGDFNQILRHFEKKGGKEAPSYLMNNFRETVEICNLKEIRVEGSTYTWCNKQEKHLVFERLDRGFCNSQWEDLFPITVEKHLQRWGYDHCPILIEFAVTVEGLDCGKKKQNTRFHFGVAWKMEEECRKIIERSWDILCVDNNLNLLAKKSSRCRRALDKWNKEKKDALINRDIKVRKQLLKDLSSATDEKV